MKKSIPVWVIVICSVGILFYGSLICLDLIGFNNFKYEVQTDGTILLNKGKFTVSSELKSYYDVDSETFYVEGILTNNTKKTYYDVNLNFAIYDLDGNILGNAYASLDRIDKTESWKFKVSYYEIDATDAVSYKLIDITYY